MTSRTIALLLGFAPMPLVIFDLDGTLTDTTHVDDECFAAALAEVLGLREIALDWSAYPHATDTGLAHEIPRRHLGRAIAPAEFERLRACFLARLHDQARARPDRFTPLPGAREVLRDLHARAGWGVGIATGAWQRSAEIKIATARLLAQRVPLATSDDSHDRAQIILASIARVLGAPAQPAGDAAPREAEVRVGGALVGGALVGEARARFGPLLYVGDGVWDARAARALGMGFVGVRVRGDFERLRAEGASEFCTGYADLPETLERFLRAGR